MLVTKQSNEGNQILQVPNMACICACLFTLHHRIPDQFLHLMAYSQLLLTIILNLKKVSLCFIQVNTQTCNTVATGIQFGLLGCLSTVSTFIAEVHLLRESKHPWRGDAYALVTIVASFGLGTLIYSVPVWTRGYDH